MQNQGRTTLVGPELASVLLMGWLLLKVFPQPPGSM